MAMSYEIEKLMNAPLEDVLLKLYPAPFYKWLYDTSLAELAKSCPEVLPQPEPGKSSAREKTFKKAYLIDLLLAVLRKPPLARQFLETLPAGTREVILAATWERRVNLAALEKALGRLIATANPDAQRIHYEPFLLPPEHGFLLLLKSSADHWIYSGKPNQKKENFVLVLPAVIRKIFQGLLPPPPDYELQPLDTAPDTAQSRFSCAQKAVADLRLTAEFIAQGNLKRTKSEQVAMPSLKLIHQLTGGPEFFENPGDSSLALLRTRLLAGGIAAVGNKERENLLAQPDNAQPVRELCGKVLASAQFLLEELLDHLANSHNRWYQCSAPAIKKLAAFFAELPAGKWVSWDNLRRYHLLRENVPSLFGPDLVYLRASAIEHANAWSTQVQVGQQNEFELVSEPLLKGYAFLLAAFGLLEIIYGPPGNTVFHLPKKAYLTPYDGLGFVRLTPLGEYVFGRRNTFDVSSGPSTQCAIILDEARLLATCRNADALTELALGQFFEKLAPGRYRLTSKSWLAGCRSREDIEKRIQLFRRVVSAAPPAIWEQLFQKTLSRLSPLITEPDMVVFKIGADEEIRRLLASDPILREVVLKVEGLRIAVHQTDLKKLAKRLEQFGYPNPIPRLR